MDNGTLWVVEDALSTGQNLRENRGENPSVYSVIFQPGALKLPEIFTFISYLTNLSLNVIFLE